MNPRKLLERIRSGATANVAFDDFCRLLEASGFVLDRITGGHRIYSHDRIGRSLPVQPVHGDAKPYQVRQFIKMCEKYGLTIGDDE